MKIFKITLIITFLNYLNNQSIVAQNQIDSSKYDCQQYTQITQFDTIVKKRCIERKSVIFKKGKNYYYKAVILDRKNDTLSKIQIKFIGTNIRNEDAPQTQMWVNMEFERTNLDSIKLHYLSNNKTCCDWVDSQKEGIIENIERVWIHPIRSNQFILTEIAGFPDVRLPLEINKTWSSTMNIMGWGEWKNSEFKNNYKVISNKKYLLNKEEIVCWEIESITDVKGETNKHTFLFNEIYGFVQMNYEYQNGIKINFDMLKYTLDEKIEDN